MKIINFLAISVIIFYSANQANAQAAPYSFADLAEKLSISVVNISTTQMIKQSEMGQISPFGNFPKNHPFEKFNDMLKQFGAPNGQNFPDPDKEQKATSLGSGFIISADGYIVTNNHVIDGADEIKVSFGNSGKEREVEVIGVDKKTDLAVLKIKGEITKPLAFVKFGDSDKSRIGDWVLVIGNPFGLGGTVTAGIISARARDINSGPFDDFIQTDAAINRGNSGGPMFNMKGEVIGINTAIYSPSGGNIGIGFSVPSNLAEPIIEQLKKGTHVKRGWLGVGIQHVTEDIAQTMGLSEPMGALVSKVVKLSPADNAGVLIGDVIIEFDGQEVTFMKKLPRIVAQTPHDKKVTMKVIRRGEEKILTVITGKLSEFERNIEGNKKLGNKNNKSEKILDMNLSPITTEFRKKYSIDKEINGLAVTALDSNSAAYERGIRSGDAIINANQVAISSVDELKQEISRLKEKQQHTILLLIQRAKDTIFIVVPIE